MVDSKQQWKAWVYLAPAIALLLVLTMVLTFVPSAFATETATEPCEEHSYVTVVNNATCTACETTYECRIFIMNLNRKIFHTKIQNMSIYFHYLWHICRYRSSYAHF